jgi:hypothetical protein
LDGEPLFWPMQDSLSVETKEINFAWRETQLLTKRFNRGYMPFGELPLGLRKAAGTSNPIRKGPCFIDSVLEQAALSGVIGKGAGLAAVDHRLSVGFHQRNIDAIQ